VYKYGIKAITLDNWDMPDEISIKTLGMRGQTDKERWVQFCSEIINIDLIGTAPIEVKKMFEVSKGIIIYGYLFYPLFTVGLEQMYRVAESAIKYKCLEIGCNNKNFNQGIKKLNECGLLDKEQINDWEYIRGARNRASPPMDQTIFTPGMILGFLKMVSKNINALFCL
jgi:hypothetical protein